MYSATKLISANDKLQILLWNARSLKNQINAFQSFIYFNSFDIVAITETWLSDHIYKNEIFRSGYTVIRRDRDGRGGGVLLAIKDCLNSTQLPSPNELEIISAEVVYHLSNLLTS